MWSGICQDCARWSWAVQCCVLLCAVLLCYDNTVCYVLFLVMYVLDRSIAVLCSVVSHVSRFALEYHGILHCAVLCFDTCSLKYLSSYLLCLECASLSVGLNEGVKLRS